MNTGEEIMKIITHLGRASEQAHQNKFLHLLIPMEALDILYTFQGDYFKKEYGKYLYKQLIEDTANHSLALAYNQCLELAATYALPSKPALQIDYRNTDMENFHDRMMFITSALITTLAAIRAEANTMASDQIGAIITMIHHLCDDFSVNLEWHSSAINSIQ